MIHTNSLIDGFPIILGSFPIQFAMTVAMAIAIRIPRDDDGNRNDRCTKIYLFVMAAHIANLISQGVNHYVDARH